MIPKAQEFISSLVDDLKKFGNDVKQFGSDIKNFLVSVVDKAKRLWNKTFNTGYKYANANPQITIDTYKMRNYAQRLQTVNKRLSTLDSRIDSLYWKVGLLDLWNLMRSDFRIGYSSRVNSCANYLNNTASEFEQSEDAILAQLN